MLREEFDDWAVLFNPDNGEVYGLNPVGVFLWKLIDGTNSVDDMLSKVMENYEHVPDASKDHVQKFVEDLKKHGLISASV